MNPRAQAGLEYLLTYGWALVLVATIVGVFVLIVGTPAESPVFNSSQPTKFPVRGGTIDTATPPKASVIVKNVTGGKINVIKIKLWSSFNAGCSGGGCKLNGTTFTPGTPISPPIQVISGGDLKFENIIYTAPGSGIIDMNYTDVHGFSRDLNITGRKGKG